MSQDDFSEHLCQMQCYLKLLQQHFPSITPLTSIELKDTCLQAQPIVFKRDFIRLCMTIENSSIEDLLEFFSKI